VGLVIKKNEMMCVLHAEHALSDRFMFYILSRNIRIEEDLIDQLFNSSEKRLARTLLLLARYGKESQPQKILPRVSQEMRYKGGLHVHNSLLNVVPHE
jgi:CRP/FNR family transcriptional regulator, cyclic AMP receptor protein